MALQYVEAQRQARPDLADAYADLADLYQRKLWHQLTLKLDHFLQLPAAQVCTFPLPLRCASSRLATAPHTDLAANPTRRVCRCSISALVELALP
jgi:hypothetical protein